MQFSEKYEKLKIELQRLKAAGKIEEWPSQAQRADWAYGNARIENDAVTRDMADIATLDKTFLLP